MEEGEEPCEEEADDGLDDLDELWEVFQQHWEQNFKKMGEAEDAQLQKISQQAKHISNEKVQQLGQQAELRRVCSDAAAKHHSQVAGVMVEAERIHALSQVKNNAEEGRHGLVRSAMQESDDMMREMEERMAQRRREGDMKRLLAKKKREAEADARRQSRERAQANANGTPPGPQPEAGRSSSKGGQGSSASGSGPRRGASPGPGSGRGAAGSSSRPSSKPPVPSPSGGAAKLRTFASFAEYDAVWAHFEKRIRSIAGGDSGSGELGFSDIPWPNGLTTVCGVAAGDSAKERKQKLRAAVLRWHPDKWAPVLAAVREQDRPEVIAKVQEVTRRILDERKYHS